jgi:hypothetical protein
MSVWSGGGVAESQGGDGIPKKLQKEIENKDFLETSPKTLHLFYPLRTCLSLTSTFFYS